MPTLRKGPVTLNYDTWGDRPPVLLLAPGGLRASRIDTWDRAPWNPIGAMSGRWTPRGVRADWEGCWANLFGVDNLMWSVPDELLPTIVTPVLVLEGDDVYHPKRASQQLTALAPARP